MAKRFLLVGSLRYDGWGSSHPRFVDGGYDTKQEAIDACVDFLVGKIGDSFIPKLPEGWDSEKYKYGVKFVREVYVLDTHGPRIIPAPHVSQIVYSE